MPLPERIARIIFATPEELEAEHLPEDSLRRLKRCRQLYFALVSNPRFTDRELRLMAKQLGARGTVMYEDVRAVKAIVGELEQHTRAWYEWLFVQRINEAVEMAREQGDAKALVAAASALARYTRLDKEEAREADFRSIGVQRFEVTTEYKPLTDKETRALFQEATEILNDPNHGNSIPT